jgi:hypothetical protein
VNALANPEVGKYVNEYFCSSFQKVGTFKVVGKQKQGGNVATYFCAPDGRVLHCVAGPVDAATLLREAKWVVENTKTAMEAARGDGAKFKAYFRKAHADKLRAETGLVVEPVTYDPPEAQEQGGALTYRDPSGQPLAPKLPPPPVDGPDVTIKAAARALEARDAAPGGLGVVRDRRGRGWALGTQGRADMLLAGHAMIKIEKVYGAVFEGILGERISTKPVEVVTPFPWVDRKGGKTPALTR